MLSNLTLTLLAERHGLSVADLRINNADLEFLQKEPQFISLTTLNINDIDLRDGPRCIASLLCHNCTSLKHLALGMERTQALEIMDIWRYDTSDSLPGYPLHFRTCIEDLVHNNSGQLGIPRLKLQSLHLVAFNSSILVEILPLLNLDNLQSLSLESCDEWADILPLPGTAISSNSTWTPRLQKFRLRREASNAMFQKHLKSFLSSFHGLVDLSVLLSGPGRILEPQCFIKNHGASLKTLVWDHRTGPREEFGISTTDVDNERTNCTLSEISLGCPNLRELGIACSAREYEIPKQVCHMRRTFPVWPSLTGYSA